MSITDELRSWAAGAKPAVINGCDIYVGPMTSGCMGALTAIADRIDAEHQKAIRELNNLADASVLLPVDADGEYIHVGDVMDSRVDYLFDGKPFTVRALVLCGDGWEVADGRFGNRYEPDSLRHHHATTVEDVLREFADIVRKERVELATISEDTIAEYAKRLTLAEGEDA